jgi:hypothetical protein
MGNPVLEGLLAGKLVGGKTGGGKKDWRREEGLAADGGQPAWTRSLEKEEVTKRRGALARVAAKARAPQRD